MKSRRVERYEKEVFQIIGQELIRKTTGILESLVSVGQVRMSGDLKKAHVQVNIRLQEDETENQVLEELERLKPFLQKQLGSKIRSKYCPKIVWECSNHLETVLRVETLIDQLKVNSPSMVKSDNEDHF